MQQRHCTTSTISHSWHQYAALWIMHAIHNCTVDTSSPWTGIFDFNDGSQTHISKWQQCRKYKQPYLLHSLCPSHYWRSLTDAVRFPLWLQGWNLVISLWFTPGGPLLFHSQLDPWDCSLTGGTSWDPQGKVRREAGWNGPSGRSRLCR